MALTELVRAEFQITDAQLLHLLIELEGHPDNAVASFRGGFVVCAPSSSDPETGFAYSRFTVDPELSFVTLVPELKLSTETARGLLPKELSLAHAVENVQRTARIAAAFAARHDYAELQGMFVDRLHQPYRQVMIPGFNDILGAACEAGALGSFLSGAGSCLMAPTLGDPDAVAKAHARGGGQSRPGRNGQDPSGR